MPLFSQISKGGLLKLLASEEAVHFLDEKLEMSRQYRLVSLGAHDVVLANVLSCSTIPREFQTTENACENDSVFRYPQSYANIMPPFCTIFLYTRVSKNKLTPFIFKLAGNLLLEFDNSHFSNDYNAF